MAIFFDILVIPIELHVISQHCVYQSIIKGSSYFALAITGSFWSRDDGLMVFCPLFGVSSVLDVMVDGPFLPSPPHRPRAVPGSVFVLRYFIVKAYGSPIRYTCEVNYGHFTNGTFSVSIRSLLKRSLDNFIFIFKQFLTHQS